MFSHSKCGILATMLTIYWLPFLETKVGSGLDYNCKGDWVNSMIHDTGLDTLEGLDFWFPSAAEGQVLRHHFSSAELLYPQVNMNSCQRSLRYTDQGSTDSLSVTV